ncbi:RlpA-like double-psi beta-barrel-protein domain-containing protein-containing protein [Xylaria sp. CBS 124048]|nr:RlpA-like double-psi beta-barrel-protein domain-containing protein-containing protein [Xylaria sp. CBS 124048]
MPSLCQIMTALATASSVFALPYTKQSGSFTGDMTYYEPGLGACGQTNSASQNVVALSPAQYSGSCGKTITITKNGRSAQAKVVDLCPSCASGSIDVSPAVFQSMADLTVGRMTVAWAYNN